MKLWIKYRTNLVFCVCFFDILYFKNLERLPKCIEKTKKKKKKIATIDYPENIGQLLVAGNEKLTDKSKWKSGWSTERSVNLLNFYGETGKKIKIKNENNNNKKKKKQ